MIKKLLWTSLEMETKSENEPSVFSSEIEWGQLHEYPLYRKCIDYEHHCNWNIQNTQLCYSPPSSSCRWCHEDFFWVLCLAWSIWKFCCTYDNMWHASGIAPNSDSLELSLTPLSTKIVAWIRAIPYYMDVPRQLRSFCSLDASQVASTYANNWF